MADLQWNRVSGLESSAPKAETLPLGHRGLSGWNGKRHVTLSGIATLLRRKQAITNKCGDKLSKEWCCFRITLVIHTCSRKLSTCQNISMGSLLTSSTQPFHVTPYLWSLKKIADMSAVHL
ncbi:hypothetical protein AVEN_172713-1 [Araneus ventricosus]|uniref:Uncharacterized protein n=1 Tax=Araneus ventricosus TaxID=182803 RepID=A0A4Y2RDP8_ARAVE|nr:hypothetical protein AVEN_172713-1 [Araneus ventricosus]